MGVERLRLHAVAEKEAALLGCENGFSVTPLTTCVHARKEGCTSYKELFGEVSSAEAYSSDFSCMGNTFGHGLSLIYRFIKLSS